MSGRDLRVFISSHRDRSDTLQVDRMFTKHGRTFADVDYDRLKEEAKARREAGEQSASKFKAIQKSTKESKTKAIVAHHKTRWAAECEELSRVCGKLEKDLLEKMRALALSSREVDPVVSSVFAELIIDEGKRAVELVHYGKGIREKVATVRSCVASVKHKGRGGAEGVREKPVAGPVHARMRALLEETKVTIGAAGAKLDTEEAALVKDIAASQRAFSDSPLLISHNATQMSPAAKIREPSGDAAVGSPTHRDDTSMQHDQNESLSNHHNAEIDNDGASGVPWELHALDCPDTRLFEGFALEFLVVDEKHRQQLDDLRARYADVVGNPNGGWSAQEHLRFVTLSDSHNGRPWHELVQRCLAEFPTRTRAQIVAHADWHHRHLNYRRRCKCVIRSWSDERKELLEAARDSFLESIARVEQAAAEAELNATVAQVRLERYERLLSWRRQKMEELRRRQEEEEVREREERERRRVEEERAIAEVREKHAKVGDYRQKKEESVRAKLEAEEKRQRQYAEAAQQTRTVNAVKVKRRARMFEARTEDRRRKEEEEEAKEREREERLERLRETVAVEAERDPMRLLQSTQTHKARMDKTAMDVAGSRPTLFSVHGYDEKSTYRDGRFRLAEAIRNAGLGGSEYARLAMDAMKPVVQPRRDLQSNVFKAAAT